MFTSAEQRRMAVIAEALFLANLLLIPGIAFALLLWLWWRSGAGHSLAGGHLRQSVIASLWAGVLLIGVTALLLLGFGVDHPAGWALALTWFVSCHAALVISGALGLARAMAGRGYRHPLIGPREVNW